MTYVHQKFSSLATAASDVIPEADAGGLTLYGLDGTSRMSTHHDQRRVECLVKPLSVMQCRHAICRMKRFVKP